MNFAKLLHLTHVFAILLLTACASQNDDLRLAPGTDLKNISIISHANLNHNTALRLDLLVIYDKSLFDHMKELSATNYFSTVEQIRRDNKGLVHIFRWEMVPLQLLEGYMPSITQRRKVWGTIFFADYHTSGLHKEILEPNAKIVRVFLGSETITAIEVNKTNAKLSEQPTRIYPLNATLLFSPTSPVQGTTTTS